MKSLANMKVEKALLITFIFIILGMTVWMKFLGATDSIGILIEKDGYCKLSYGEDWDFNEKEELCKYKFISENKEPIDFTEKEFRNFCPNHKFISRQFFSDCWNAGDSR